MLVTVESLQSIGCTVVQLPALVTVDSLQFTSCTVQRRHVINVDIMHVREGTAIYLRAVYQDTSW